MLPINRRCSSSGSFESPFYTSRLNTPLVATSAPRTIAECHAEIGLRGKGG